MNIENEYRKWVSQARSRACSCTPASICVQRKQELATWKLCSIIIAPDSSRPFLLSHWILSLNSQSWAVYLWFWITTLTRLVPDCCTREFYRTARRVARGCGGAVVRQRLRHTRHIGRDRMRHETLKLALKLADSFTTLFFTIYYLWNMFFRKKMSISSACRNLPQAAWSTRQQSCHRDFLVHDMTRPCKCKKTLHVVVCMLFQPFRCAYFLPWF